MLLVRGGVYTPQLLMMRKGMRIERAATEGRVVFRALCVCYCDLDVQHETTLTSARDNCVTLMSSAQGSYGSTKVVTRGLLT